MISCFNPVQSQSLRPLLKGKNIIICAPTASGKTTIAEVAIARCVEDFKVSVYIAPMKSLCEEKVNDWKKLFKDYTIVIQTGDYGKITDRRKQMLMEADIIIATYEMLDSRLTHKDEYLKDVGCLIVDESHMLSSEGRGAILENAIIQFCRINPKAQIIFLSATLSDLDKLKIWLEKLTNREVVVIESDYRPCKLTVNYEPFDDDKGAWHWGNRMVEVERIIQNHSEDKFLVFCPSRKDSTRTAKRLRDLGFKAEYHNASLDLSDRRDREGRFKNGDLQILASTPTLALGINLPARRVIVEGSYRGLNPISSLEVLQCCGRAGRPQYDKEGFATVLVPQSKREVEEIRLSDVKIDSVLGNVRDLLFHLTKLVYLGIVKTGEEAEEWWKDTFGYQLYGYVVDVRMYLEKLVRWEVLEMVGGGRYDVTHLGRISSLLYFYPDDIVAWKKGFEEVVNKDLWGNDVQVCKGLVCPTQLQDGYVTKDEKGEVMEFYNTLCTDMGCIWSDEDLVRIKYIMYYYYCLNQYKLPEEVINNKKGFIGILRADSERVIQALEMLSGFLRWGVGDRLGILKMRLRYGIPPDAAELVTIRGIGSKRGIELYKKGLKTKRDLVNNKGKVYKILGNAVASGVFRQLKDSKPVIREYI